MTKTELEKRISALEKTIQAMSRQLNDHVCDQRLPIPVTIIPFPPSDGTVKPDNPWPGTTWRVAVN